MTRGMPARSGMSLWFAPVGGEFAYGIGLGESDFKREDAARFQNAAGFGDQALVDFDAGPGPP